MVVAVAGVMVEAAPAEAAAAGATLTATAAVGATVGTIAVVILGMVGKNSVSG